jgi:hypothetical protein
MKLDSRQQWGLRGGTTFDKRGHVGGVVLVVESSTRSSSRACEENK